MANRSIKLRAFDVDNITLTSTNKSLFEHIITNLSKRPTINDRLMLLNQDSAQSYVLAYSEISGSGNSIFGLVLDVIPYENGGELSKDLLKEQSIKLSQVTQAKENSLLCKDHFYFYLTPSILIATCKRSSIISKLQTYLNWIVDDVRENAIMSFTPLIETVNLVPPTELRSMEIGNISLPVGSGASVKKLDVKKWLGNIFDEVPELNELRENEVLQAFLTLKFKRPKKMSIEDYSKLLGNFAKSVETSEDIKLTNKKGNTIKGNQIEKFKIATINCTLEGLIVEQDLKQMMQSYVQEINNERQK